MSAMEDMAVSILSKIIPKSFLEMLTVDNMQKLEQGVKAEYQGVKDQLNRIEALLTKDQLSIGERMELGDGFIVDSDKEPLPVIMIEDHNDGSNDSGKPLPGWERFNGNGGNH